MRIKILDGSSVSKILKKAVHLLNEFPSLDLDRLLYFRERRHDSML